MSDAPVARHRTMLKKDVLQTFTRPVDGSGNGSCTADPMYRTFASVSGTLLKQYHSVTMDDFVTPDFRRQSARGRIINLPMEKTETIKEYFPGTIDRVSGIENLGCTPQRWYLYSTRNQIGPMDSYAFITKYMTIQPYASEPGLSANKEQALRELAITDAYASIGNSDVMALVALAEAGKTVDGLKSTFLRVNRILFKLVKGAKRLKQKQVKTEANKLWLDKRLKKDLVYLSKEMKDLYMEARYGLRPLYYDLKGLVKVLTKPNQLAFDRLTFRGRQDWGDSNDDRVVKRILYESDYLDHDVTFIRSTKVDLSVRAGVLTSFKDLGLAQAFGLDLLAESAWELVRLSFVLDWFLNVGKLISSWTPNYGFKALASWVTVRKTVTKTITIGDTVITPRVYASVRPCNYHTFYSGGILECTSVYKRIPNPSRPVLPHFNVKLDALKLVDLAIILSQTLGLSKTVKNLRI